MPLKLEVSELFGKVVVYKLSLENSNSLSIEPTKNKKSRRSLSSLFKITEKMPEIH